MRERGGAALAGVADVEEAGLDSAPFACVLIADDELLPLLARLRSEQAAALLALASLRAGESPAALAARCERLHGAVAAGLPAYLLKAGRVGGAHQPAIELDDEGRRATVAALAEGAVEWERDPDFGWELAVGLAGWEGSGLLVPRFHYRRADRVYEYAALVPRTRAAWREELGAVPGLAARVAAAFDAGPAAASATSPPSAPG